MVFLPENFPSFDTFVDVFPTQNASSRLVLPFINDPPIRLSDLIAHNDSYPLPLTPPDGDGLYWLNGGVVCVTPGGESPLPTTLPINRRGLLWNDGGVVAIVPGGNLWLPTSPFILPGIPWNNGNVLMLS